MFTATDLFCGAGGSSEGLRRAGWHVAIAANHWDAAVATHQANHPDTEHRSEGLSEVDWRTFPTTTLLWASPSCVWHARSGGRKAASAASEWRRDTPGAIDRASAFAVVEAAELHRYPAIIVENVPEFQDWALYTWWLAGLRHLGYHIETRVLDAADFGHAQHRRRWFLVATRDTRVDLTPPEPTFVPATEVLDQDLGKTLTRRLYVSDQIEAITDLDIPHLVTYRRNARPRRADRHRLATITAGGNHHAVATVTRHGTTWHRMLTNRECARAQGFADEHVFLGNTADVKRQIGNAVPIGIAHWLGTRVAAALTNTTHRAA